MKIAFKKISNTHHELSVLRSGKPTETVHCETRSFLKHDLIHYAVEGEAQLESGFWGMIANGRTLAELNDRTGKDIPEPSEDIMVIEAVVGALHNVSQLESPATFIAALKNQGEGLGWVIPPWFTEEFIKRVKERMRQLNGQWNATSYGDSMELSWPLDNLSAEK